MRQNFFSTMALVVFSCIFLFFNSGCQKDASQNLSESNNADKDRINAWLDKEKISSKVKEAAIIQSVKDNLEFSKLRYEELYDGEKLIIVPFNNNFKSRNNVTKKPINVILFVLDKTNNIRKGNIIQYIPTNSQVKSVPVNTFYNFFNFKNLGDDAQLTFLSVIDEFLYEYKIEKGKMLSFSRLQKKPKLNGRTTEETCTSWYLVTTWEDGREDWQYLYTVCEDVPCDLARIINGLVFRSDCNGGNGGGESAGTDVSRLVKLSVWREYSGQEDWEIWTTWTVTGRKFSNVANNIFTGIEYDNQTWWRYVPAPTGWELSSTYAIFSKTEHTENLQNSTTAYGKANSYLTYPNWPGQPNRIRAFSSSTTWQASVAFY